MCKETIQTRKGLVSSLENGRLRDNMIGEREVKKQRGEELSQIQDNVCTRANGHPMNKFGADVQ